MNKTEFINSMASSHACTRAEAERALNMMISGLILALQKGNSVNLAGFGSFDIQKRNSREGRNPKTGEKMHIPAYSQLMFKANKRLKDSCNG